MSASCTDSTVKRLRAAAEASLLFANGTSIALPEDMSLIRDDPYYLYGDPWDREQWCMAFLLTAAMVEAGDA
jgi:hypothetical protein